MAKNTEIKGMKELEKAIQRLEKLPQKCVTKAARKGANIALKSAKRNAPVDIGNLKRGLVLKGERARIKGKKVYQVTFDRAMNRFFVKVSEEGKRSYYPASQEFGFMTRGGGYTPGYQYMKKSIDDNEEQIKQKTVDVLALEIDKIK